MYKEALIFRMLEGAAFSQDIVRHRSAERRYLAFENAMAKLTESETETRSMTGPYLTPKVSENGEALLEIARPLMKAKLREFVMESSCEHVIGGSPCRACLNAKLPEIAEDSVRLARQKLPRAFGRSS